MRILLLGATGRTGRYVLEKALEDGLEVNCLVRNAGGLKPQKGLTIFEGNPNDATKLEEAITGCEGVLSVLNISRHSDFPWSKLRTPENYLSEVMGKLIPIAEKSNVKRITICSAWGVAETEKDIPKWFKWIIDNSNVGAAYRDHVRQEDLLSKSRLNWTIVRPVGLTNSGSNQVIRESFDNKPKPSLTVSRKRVAKYLVESLTNERLIFKRVVISKE